FWAAVSFEVQVGKFDVAAYHLNGLLRLEPKDKTDQDLLAIEEIEGMNTFLRLLHIKGKWNQNPKLEKEAQDNVEQLLKRVTDALEIRLSDPARIKKFINNLDAGTVEERAYAFGQLKRSRERATPYLVEALRNSAGTILHEKIKEAMLKLDRDVF